MAYFYYDADKVAKSSVVSRLESEWEVFNEKKLIKYIITPGYYPPDYGLIKFTPDNTHNIHDYPFMALSYKSNSNVFNMDISIVYTDTEGEHESWTEKDRPPLLKNKNINALVYDVRKTNAVCFPGREYDSYSYLIKPFGGQIGGVASACDFSINYIAFFETAEEAEKFNLDNTPDKIAYEEKINTARLDRIPAYAKKYYGDTPVTVFSGYDFKYNICLAPRTHELDVTLGKNGAMSFFTGKKFYLPEQNEIKISSAGMNFSPRVYSYVRIAYKNSTDKTLARVTWDKCAAEYTKLNKSAEENGYAVSVFDINELSSNEITDRYGNITLCFKNAELDNKEATETLQFEILYIAFFKDAKEAEKFKYNGVQGDYLAKHPMAYIPEKGGSRFIETDDFSVADKYINDAEELKHRIHNSKNNYETNLYGTTYYVSSINGNDENDGLSASTPLRTCKKIAGTLKPCDYVLFERGSIFRECIKIEKGVTYSAYGEGEKPRFYNSYNGAGADKWSLTDKENVWVFNESIPSKSDIGNITFDSGKAWGIKVLKRLNGEKIWQGYCFNGYECVYIPVEEFKSYKDMKYNLEFFHDWVNEKLYLYCKFGNPGEYFKEIEISKKGSIFHGEASKCVIDNINIMYTGSHGIGVGVCSDFTIQYCEFGFIGGSIQSPVLGMNGRFGNAVECFGSAENYVIHDCYAYQVYDCCFTTQWQGSINGDLIMNNVRFYNNVAELSNTGLETWLACHCLYTDNQYKFRNMELFNNYNMYMGYGWSHQRFNKDSNFFYGDMLVSETCYENCSIHHNVNVYTWQTATYARYIGKNGFNFHDNVYVIERDRDFAFTALTPIDGSGKMVSYRADKKSMDLLLEHTVEENSVIYSVPENCGINSTSKALYEAEGRHSYGYGGRCQDYGE